MSFTILNYEYHLEGYTDKPFSLKEYKTSHINNDTNDNCPIITTNPINNNVKFDSNSLSSSMSSMTSSLSSSDSSNVTDSSEELSEDIKYNREKLREKGNIIRSCDHFNGNIIETNENINLVIDDKNKELQFNLKFNGININSYDLIKLTNTFGAKKMQKNFDNRKIFENFRDSDIIKLYDKDTALNIIYKVQEIFNSRLKEIENNCINIINYLSVLKDTNSQWEKNNEPINNTSKKKYFDYIDTFIISLSSFQQKNNFTHAKIIKPNKNENFVVLGDFHGSLSTFIRHLLRFKKIGIINENGKIKDNYKIIFLGDIVDRGIYSYEIVMILYLLLINNPDQIILINGNHEELETNGRFNRTLYESTTIESSKSYVGNFINELFGKFRNINEMLEIYTGIINIMRLQPSCLLSEDPNEKNKMIYMAHGCLPHDKNNVNKLDKTFKEKLKEKKSFCINNNIGMSIRWNDFHGNNNTIKSERTFNYTPEIQKIGKNVLNDANESGIAMVIRGHEDLHYNTKIIDNGSSEWISINEVIEHNDNNIIECKNKDDKLGNMTHVIKLNNNNNNLIINRKETNYLPIMTISTNTDIGKNLTSDSYVIISFSSHDYTAHHQNGGNYKYKYIKYSNKLTSH
jgi:hypothetical protein